MFKLLLSFFALIVISLSAQERDMIYMYNESKAILYFTTAPERGEYIIISRKSEGSEYKVLNDTLPLKAVEGSAEAISIIGSDFAAINRIVDADNEIQLIRALKGNSFNSTILTLLFPGAAFVAGRLYEDSDVVAGKSYEYKIEYYSYEGEKLSEFTKKVTATPVLPASPENLSVKSVKGVVTLKWDYPSWEKDKNNIATNFRIYRKTGEGAFSQINQGIIIRDDNSEKVFTDLRPDENIRYEYYVSAVDPAGRESNPSKIVVLLNDEESSPEPPGGLNAGLNSGTVLLYWNISPDQNITGYNLYRKENISGDSLKLNRQLIAYSNPQFSDSTVRSGVQYFYYVTAVSKGGSESPLSSVANVYVEDTTPPLPPSIAGIKFDEGKVVLSIKASSSKDVAGYRVYKGETKDIMPLAGFTQTLSFTDSGYAGRGYSSGGSINFSVSSVDFSENESVKSEIVTVTVPDVDAPPAPSPVTAVLKPGNRVEVSSGNSAAGDVALMKIFRREGDAQPVLLVTLENFPATYTDNSCVLLKTYTYLVQSIDTSGNASGFGESAPVTVKDLFAPPAVPFLTAVNSQVGVKLNWIRVVEPDLKGYNVYRSSLPNGNYEKMNSEPLNETNFLDKSGTKEYFYKVRAVDTSENESEWSSYVAVTEEGE